MNAPAEITGVHFIVCCTGIPGIAAGIPTYAVFVMDE
jgi:hypothetical protein